MEDVILARPLLSVIVPVYKAEKYIHRCVNSILNQTLEDLELILVDDGSPDNSGAICDEYAQKDARVKVLHKENGGAASARNAGLDLAEGKYIGFCDSDDYVNHDMYETLISVMKENNLATIECLANVYDLDGNLVDSEKDDRKLTVVTEEDAIKNVFIHKGNVSLAVRVTDADCIKEIRIPEGRRVEDFYFTIELLKKTKGTAIYNYPFYNCILSDGSVTRAGGGSIYLDAIYFFEKSVELLSAEKCDYKKEQEFFLFKAYYLLFISSYKDERKKFKKEFLRYKRNIQKKLKVVLSNPYLIKKEKLVLCISALSVRLARVLYILKNNGDK